MNFTYDLQDISEFILSFAVESGEIVWYQNGIKKSGDFINEALKSQLPIKKMFKMNSLIYNVETQSQETNITFLCSYENEKNVLSIIVDENINHNNFTKEVAMTLFNFVQKTGIDKLYLIMALKNPNYILLLQEMMTLGFESEKSIKSTKIGGDMYKILFIETKNMSVNIEEFGI